MQRGAKLVFCVRVDFGEPECRMQFTMRRSFEQTQLHYAIAQQYTNIYTLKCETVRIFSVSSVG